MKMREVPNLNYAGIEWIDSDNPKYKSRSRDAYPHCVDCNKNHRQNETEPMAYVYKNNQGNLYVHCHRCGDTFSVVEYADAVIF